jgi:hypothetical protein
MSSERTELEKSIVEVLNKFMDDRAMSEGVHTSSTKVLQASPSTRRCLGRANPATKQRSKHRNNMANTKQASLILPDYISHLAGTVNFYNIPQKYEYTLIIAYIPKGIRIVGS